MATVAACIARRITQERKFVTRGAQAIFELSSTTAGVLLSNGELLVPRTVASTRGRL